MYIGWYFNVYISTLNQVGIFPPVWVFGGALSVCVCVCLHNEGFLYHLWGVPTLVRFVLKQVSCHKWQKHSCGNHQQTCAETQSSMRTRGTSLEASAATWYHCVKSQKKRKSVLFSVYIYCVPREGASHQSWPSRLRRWFRVESWIPKGSATRLKRGSVLCSWHDRSMDICRTKQSMCIQMQGNSFVTQVTCVWKFCKALIWSLQNDRTASRFPADTWLPMQHSQILTRIHSRYS